MEPQTGTLSSSSDQSKCRIVAFFFRQNILSRSINAVVESVLLQVLKEFEIFNATDKPGRLMMIVLSPRINAAEVENRVVTLAHQAKSLLLDRCEAVISIVVCGKGKTAYGKLPRFVARAKFEKLTAAAKGMKLASMGNQTAFSLFFKTVSSILLSSKYLERLAMHSKKVGV